MNKFNLEKWKAGAKVCTRDGRQVENLTYFPNALDFQLAGVLDGEIDQWTDNGCYFAHNDEPNGNDLVMDESRYVFVFKDGNKEFVSRYTYSSSLEARNKAIGILTAEELVGVFKLIQCES